MSELGRLVTELQVKGVRTEPLEGNRGRRGGAGATAAGDLSDVVARVRRRSDCEVAKVSQCASVSAGISMSQTGCSLTLTCCPIWCLSSQYLPKRRAFAALKPRNVRK